MAGEDTSTRDDVEEEDLPNQENSGRERSGWLRLFIIPLLVYIAWLVETFLLARQARLFEDPGAAGVYLYTLITCILIGLVIPVMCIRRSFLSGAVNMHQVGFRPAWRTGPVVLVTILILLPISLLLNPFGSDRLAFFMAFLLLLPTAIASVMVCFVLLGTHVQAFLRDGGIIASLSSGVIITSVLFAFSSLVRSTGILPQETLLLGLGTGVLISVFFFAVRDVYATVLVTAVCLVFGMAGQVSRPALELSFVPVSAAACLAILFLLGIHVYFYRNYTTILVRAK
jgi:hypothetical protein